jgi:hypothetical protein
MTGLLPVVLLYSAGAIYKPARHKESLYFMAFQMFNERILNPKKRKKEKKGITGTSQCGTKFIFYPSSIPKKIINKIWPAMSHDCRT